MKPELLAQILSLLAAPASAARVAKSLGLAQSELNRALLALGEHAEAGGLGLVKIEDDGERRLLSLTERGRQWLEQHR